MHWYEFGVWTISDKVYLKRKGQQSVYGEMGIDGIKEKVFGQRKLEEF